MLQPLLADCLSGLPRIAHGFFTRAGGVSEGIYASLNCGLGSKDDVAAVRENRARVGARLGADHLLSLHQVHGTVALTVEAAWPERERPRADAMVTRVRGLALGVLTADCAPVLLADPEAGVIAAAHAGWRGALVGVLGATIATMEQLGARRTRISAAVGPCIGQAAYEVGEEFEREFLDRDQASRRFFVRAASGRPHLDLAAYTAYRLGMAGLGNTAVVGQCTYTQSENLFSYRRSRARNETDYGRQISAIVLT